MNAAAHIFLPLPNNTTSAAGRRVEPNATWEIYNPLLHSPFSLKKKVTKKNFITRNDFLFVPFRFQFVIHAFLSLPRT